MVTALIIVAAVPTALMATFWFCHESKPKLFRLSATLTRWFSLTLESSHPISKPPSAGPQQREPWVACVDYAVSAY